MNTTTVQVAVADEQTKKYLTLLELSKAIASHRELPALFHDLACRLGSLFDFTHLGVLLYDERQKVMRLHVVETCEPVEWQAPKEVPMEGSIAGWVWQKQEPVVVRNLDLEDRFPVAKTVINYPVKAVCSLPLTTAHQRLGVMTFWSEKAGAYDGLDLEFAKLVTAQIAVAVEAQFHQNNLVRERDRSQLLLEINNTLVSNLNLRELLSAISHSLNTVMPHDAAALALYDESLKQLRLTALDFPAHEEPCAAGEIIPLEGTPAGLAFTTREPVLSDYCKTKDARVVSSGLKSGCTAPLLFRDRTLGVLIIKSLRENAFSQEDAELLGQVAKQVAIAVENALAYREIETLKNKLEGEKLYLEEEIRTEYNFEEIIGNSAALKRVLQEVETVAATNSTVLIYGETGTGKELIAHAIHNLSERRERTLVKVNCAAIPTGLLESELFGHEKGAFTGAIDRRIGRFELANQGTIFLDEVEDIPLELQSKLLRVLQEH
ncbi:MAG TPA: sigma 54-interacting transcriptional regulator, partial [Pyrinomonadaceae bacterium]|nr:sigma 54-interacting transcriptional regulator [Pyrinomonadaceae bacterium]